MLEPKISVLIPFKNEKKFIAQTLESIFSQDEQNFEIIAVDDHSDDNSVKIVSEYTAKDSRIKLFTNNGSGTISALKTALENSSGELITRQDADDLQPTEKLAELKHLLTTNGPGHIATGLVKYFCEDKTVGNGFLKYEKWLNNLCRDNSHRKNLFKECVIASSNWMLFKDDLKRIKGIQEAEYPEDYFFVFKVFEHNIKVVSSNKVTHLWRDHPNRASRTLEQYRDQKFFPMKVKFFKKFHGSKNITLWGTGPSGKKLAKELLKEDISFHWVSNNKKKIGAVIYGVKIYDYNSLAEKHPQNVIVSVTQRGSSIEIDSFLTQIDILQRFDF